MKLKLIKVMVDGKEVEVAVVQNGKPIYVHDNGQEVEFDAPGAMAKIGELNNEAKGHRLSAKEANEKLALYAGIPDPAAAKKAMDFAASVEGKKIMDDEGIKKLIAAQVQPHLDENANLKKQLEQKDGHIYKLEVTNRFTGSEFLKKNTVLGEMPEMAEAYFGRHFKIENGRAVAYDQNNNAVYSRTRPGELADFEEALSILVESHPKKDHILKAKGASGSGAQGNGGKPDNVKSMKRADFDRLPPAEQSKFSLGGGKLED